MKTSTKGLNLIMKYEGLRLTAYLPTPNDKWTIGYGHTKGVYKGMTITESEAVEYLKEDIAWAEDSVNQLVKVPLNQNQFDALVSFVFNVGATQFANSTLLRLLNAGDYKGASDQFPRWKYQSGQVLKGLVNRRAEEMATFDEAINEENPVQSVDGADTLKPIYRSKEIWAGLTGALAGTSSLLVGLVPEESQGLSAALSVALTALGSWVVYNRAKARKKGER